MKLALDKIKVNPKNPRFIKDDNFKKLVQSLKDLPVMTELREVLLDEDNMIIGGNMRYRAAKEAGWTEIPAKIFTREMAEENNKLTEQNKTYEEYRDEIIIKDNISGGDWDWDILANEWNTELLATWGVDFPDYHSINQNELNDIDDFNEVLNADDFYHLNFTFEDEQTMQDFMDNNNIILNNNYKRVGKVISLRWPLEQRRDVKNLEFK